MKVSIVVPVYNAGKYLRKCFDSLVNQTYRDIEIIAIDDGSTDDSGIICDEYSQKYKNFICFHKKNEGQAIARNAGLNNITGDYVMFVDSDDYIELNAVEFLLNKIIKDNSDVLFYTDYVLHYDGNITSAIYPYPNHVLERDEIINNLYPHSFGAGQRKNDTYGVTSVCLAMYRTTFLKENNICFEEKGRMMCEDILFNMKMSSYANRASFINKPLYTYRMCDGSTTHSYDENKLNRTLHLYEYQKEFNEASLAIPKAKTRAQDLLIANITSLLKNVYKSNNSFKQKIKDIKQISKDKRLIEYLSDYPFNELIITKRLIIEATLKEKVLLVYLLLFLRDKK